MADALIDQLLNSLRELPDVHVELAQAEPAAQAVGRADATIELQVAGKSIALLVEAKKSVYPRDVRQALWQLKSPQHDHYTNGQRLLIAESISPGAKELLRAERIGYFDSGGSLFLPAAGAYVYIDKPAPKALEKSVRSLFSGRRTQVLHALLVNHEQWFGVTDVAERAQVAPSTASDVLHELERFDWLTSRGQGPSKERHLREPGALLDAWARQLATQRAPLLRRYFVPGLKSDALIERLGQLFATHEITYAVSQEAAAQRYAPFLSSISQTRVRLLPSPAPMPQWPSWVHASSMKGELRDHRNQVNRRTAVSATGRRHLVGKPDPGLSRPLAQRGPRQESAEHLRKERIGF